MVRRESTVTLLNQEEFVKIYIIRKEALTGCLNEIFYMVREDGLLPLILLIEVFSENNVSVAEERHFNIQVPASSYVSVYR